MVTVVTGFNQAGLEEYGYKTIDSFNKYWPKEVKRIVYLEEPADIVADEIRYADSIPQLIEFLKDNKDNLFAHGKRPTKNWSEKDYKAGYCYKFDIMKFCKQVMYTYAGALDNKDGIYIWLDGDVLTTKQIPLSFLENIIPPGKSVAYLGRTNKHSEIGFVAFRLPDAIPLLYEYARPIIDGTVFKYDEWHSAYLFDKAVKLTGLSHHNMTPTGRGHVWFQSELGEYMDHLKGKRKTKGRSPERGR